MQHLFTETRFTHCPGCGSDALEALTLQLGAEPPSGPFQPTGRPLKWLRATHGVALRGNQFQMCRACGMVFRQDDPSTLNDFLARYAKD